MSLNQGHRAHAFRRGEFTHLGIAGPALHLHADLHHAPRPFISPAHAAGMLGIERHGLFLIDVLARLNGGNKAQGVLMLGSYNNDGVDAFVVQQSAEVLIGFDSGNDGLHFFQMTGVHIGHRHRLDVGTLDGRFEIELAARASSNQADSNAVIGSQHAAR